MFFPRHQQKTTHPTPPPVDTGVFLPASCIDSKILRRYMITSSPSKGTSNMYNIAPGIVHTDDSRPFLPDSRPPVRCARFSSLAPEHGGRPLRQNPVTRGPRTVLPVKYWPSDHGARTPRSADSAWLCCGPTRGTFLPTPSTRARAHQHCIRLAVQAMIKAYPPHANPAARGQRAFRPVEYLPAADRACASVDFA